MYVCLCHAVTQAELDDVIAAGARDVDAVGEACGAGTNCGSCRPVLQELIVTCPLRMRHVAA